ncbi:winged helix-turn-helix domain-containing protein [Streptomyces sp. NPDC046853]|uniref:GntR family transcriptional regulator n=1 Tax=Streptomyces sp. NPDC046853 TaxID=3154920 RepID=UPI0033DEDBA0
MQFAPDIPRWRQVADVIRRRIEDGTYAPRTRVPSVAQIIDEFGIATATAQKVHRGLRAEGLIYTEPGMGSFVSLSSTRPTGPVEDEGDTRAIWKGIAATIAERIAQGEYPVGGRVPSVLGLSAEFDVAGSTAQKVLAHLRAEGLVRTEVGLGTFVAERPAPDPDPT